MKNYEYVMKRIKNKVPIIMSNDQNKTKVDRWLSEKSSWLEILTHTKTKLIKDKSFIPDFEDLEFQGKKSKNTIKLKTDFLQNSDNPQKNQKNEFIFIRYENDDVNKNVIKHDYNIGNITKETYQQDYLKTEHAQKLIKKNSLYGKISAKSLMEKKKNNKIIEEITALPQLTINTQSSNSLIKQNSVLIKDSNNFNNKKDEIKKNKAKMNKENDNSLHDNSIINNNDNSFKLVFNNNQFKQNSKYFNKLKFFITKKSIQEIRKSNLVDNSQNECEMDESYLEKSDLIKKSKETSKNDVNDISDNIINKKESNSNSQNKDRTLNKLIDEMKRLDNFSKENKNDYKSVLNKINQNSFNLIDKERNNRNMTVKLLSKVNEAEETNNSDLDLDTILKSNIYELMNSRKTENSIDKENRRLNYDEYKVLETNTDIKSKDNIDEHTRFYKENKKEVKTLTREYKMLKTEKLKNLLRLDDMSTFQYLSKIRNSNRKMIYNSIMNSHHLLNNKEFISEIFKSNTNYAISNFSN